MRIFFLVLTLFFAQWCNAQNKRQNIDTSESVISRVQAINFLSKIVNLSQSTHWPNITPADFLKNVKQNIERPLKLYAGSGTNFCGYAAVTYSCLKNEPLRYAQCMVQLYQKGVAKYRNISLNPSQSIKDAAGQMIYQGALDINPADQMWFLCLAHKFKGYLNILDLKYNEGDENTMWASTNLAKFNRMLRRLCKYKIKSRGSDLIKPHFNDLPGFLKEKLAKGEVYLYLNNSILRKKNHDRLKKKIPTHYVVLTTIENNNNVITLNYWDGGYKTVKEVSLNRLKEILYGISWVKYKEMNDEKIDD
jgi:hypothetical protein